MSSKMKKMRTKKVIFLLLMVRLISTSLKSIGYVQYDQFISTIEGQPSSFDLIPI